MVEKLGHSLPLTLLAFIFFDENWSVFRVIRNAVPQSLGKFMTNSVGTEGRLSNRYYVGLFRWTG